MRNFGSAIKVATALCLATSLLLSSSQNVFATTSNTVSISMIGKYDSADTAAIRSVDTDKKQIRLRNHATGKTYTLDYDNTSMMFDARGVVLSPQMLEAGQIVDVTFLKSTKHITTLNVSKDAWVIDSTKDHELVRNDGTARIGSDIYHIDTKTLVMADDEIAIAENILSTDRIKVSGIGKDIYSVVVTSGHGYVSLSSDTVEERSLVGAWIELDNEVIHKISPNMLLSAPEGDYNLQIIGNGANFQSEVSISRNEETVVDTSEVTISRPKEGLVTFEIIPDTAEVYVDGEKMLTGVTQSIQYGYHNLKIMADGYVTQNRYLKIGTAKSVINIELEKKEEPASAATSNSLSENTVHNATVNNNSSAKSSLAVKHADANELISKSASAATTASTVSSNSSSSSSSNKVIDGYYIYFDEPEYAELYFDGNYIGIIPTKIQKISGNHEVILKRSGYQTKSYRLKIDTATENVIYEFPDMEKEDDGKSTSSTSSSAAATSASSAASTASTSASTAASSAASKDASKDSSKEASTSASKEASKDASKDASKEASTSASKDASKEASKDATKDASNNASKEATKDAAKDATKETSNEASKDATKEATAETTKEASSDTNKEVPSDTSTNNATVPTTEKQEEGTTTPQAEETPSNEASQTTEPANDSSDVSDSANEASGEN